MTNRPSRPGIWGSYHWLDEERRSARTDLEPIDRPDSPGHKCPPDEECDTCACGHELGHDLADHPVPCEQCGGLTAYDEERAPVRGWVVCAACLEEYDREMGEARKGAA